MLVVSEGLCHGLLSAESWPCQGTEPRDGPASCSAGEVKTLRAAGSAGDWGNWALQGICLVCAS